MQQQEWAEKRANDAKFVAWLQEEDESPEDTSFGLFIEEPCSPLPTEEPCSPLPNEEPCLPLPND